MLCLLGSRANVSADTYRHPLSYALVSDRMLSCTISRALTKGPYSPHPHKFSFTTSFTLTRKHSLPLTSTTTLLQLPHKPSIHESKTICTLTSSQFMSALTAFALTRPPLMSTLTALQPHEPSSRECPYRYCRPLTVEPL